MINKVFQGEALATLKTLPADSVDCIVTSPPYWALRDYGVEGQLGLEPTFEQFIENLCLIFDEVRRVMKPTGTCWVNLGDTYGGSWGNYGARNANQRTKKTEHFERKGALPKSLKPATTNMPEKCLLQIPSRFAIAMTDRGWILRNEIIWHKPNCMPASVKDRFTVDYEKVFMFVKSKTYYFDANAVAEPITDSTILRISQDVQSQLGSTRANGGKKTNGNMKAVVRKEYAKTMGGSGTDLHNYTTARPVRNKRCVWKIATAPYKDAHFATFPPELVETPIKSGCPKQACVKCGHPRMPIYEPSEAYAQFLGKGYHDHENDLVEGQRIKDKMNAEYEMKGYEDCDCNAGFVPGIVLDPFLGSGTTAEVAMKLGLRYVGIELNPEYHKMIRKRLAQKVLL